jgi:cyclopropane fatty-acyl-phospholipid synthase-like methyltransferase
MNDEVAGFKARQRAVWSAGDYDSVAEMFWAVGAVVAETAAIEPGMKVLDVATGTGGAAIPAAEAGGAVVGLDLTPELFDDARRHAEAAGEALLAELRALLATVHSGEGEVRIASEYLLAVGHKP